MTELYENIRQEVRDTAEGAWILISSKVNPFEAARLLSDITEYYRNIYTEEEIEFLQFYFNVQIEMMRQ